MAIISKIRDKSGLIVFIVGLGLVLFIIPFDTILQKFGGAGEQPMGEINGQSIIDTEWKFSENVQFESDKIRSSNPGYSFTEKDIVDIENSVWGRIISDTLLQLEYAKLGLRVGSKELNDVLIFGEYTSSVIREIPQFNMDFGNGQKMFLKDSAMSYFRNEALKLEALKGNEKSFQEAQMYYNWTLPITNARLKEKYLAMMRYAVIGNKIESQRLHKEQNTSAEISYIFLNYMDIADSLVTVTDKDLKAYYEKHSNEVKYKNDGDVRGFKYVLFPIKPSEKDLNELSTNLNGLKETFKTAKNDTAFLIANAASAKQSAQSMDILPEKPYEPGSSQFPIDVDSAIIKGSKGDVIGPFLHMNNSKMLLVKVISAENKKETEVRHIFLTKKGTDETLNAPISKTADSLATILKGDKSKFAQLALQFNQDKSSPNGVIRVDSASSNQWGEAFKTAALSNSVGSVSVVTTDMGYHVMEVMERGEFKYNRIAIVDKDVVPSKITRQSLEENLVLPFITKLEKGDSTIEKLALANGVMASELPRIYLANPTQSMSQIGFSMDIMTWAFNREVGSVSDAILVEGNNFFVGQITYAAAEGVPSFEAAKDDMKIEVLKEKKAEYVKKLIGESKSLEEAVAKLPKAQIQIGKVTLADNYLAPGQTDPVAVAHAFVTKEGATSNLVVGDAGVYMIKVNKKAVSTLAEDLTAQRNEITERHRNSVDQGYIMALYRAADVKDWRMKRKVTMAN